MAKEDGGINGLVAVRSLLKTSLENSLAISSALNDSGQRLEGIRERILPLEAATKCEPPGTFCAIRASVDHALGPVSAVLKIYGSVREVEKLLAGLSPRLDLHGYLNLVKQLGDAMRFLSANCGLAIQWLEDTLMFVEASRIGNQLYTTNLKKSFRILQDLQGSEERAVFDGGLLCAAIGKLEAEFGRLLAENSSPEAVVKKLQAIIGRLSACNSLGECLRTYVEARSTIAETRLRELGLEYLEKRITESEDVEDLEGDIDRWCKHFELALKLVFSAERELCNEVFSLVGSEVRHECFARIAVQSGILRFLQFGKNVTECKKTPIKLLKLLDMFKHLENLRMDFNKLFGGEACNEIRDRTRELIGRVVNGAADIFWELSAQVELQRQCSPPLDGSVPKLVLFVTYYCNRLLRDDYKPLLDQVLLIQHNWKNESYSDELLPNQIVSIIREIGLNLDAWTKSHQDTTLSYLFMMNNHSHFCSLNGTDLGRLMGDPWIRGHEKYKDYYMTLYLKHSWARIHALLKQHIQIPASPTRVLPSDLVKRRLRSFYEEFDSMYERHSNWVVPDENLRLKICKVTVQSIVPAYRIYLQVHGLKAGENSSPSKYLKYTPQGIESMLSSLFQPNMRRIGSSKQTHFIGRIKDIVTDHLRLPLMAS